MYFGSIKTEAEDTGIAIDLESVIGQEHEQYNVHSRQSHQMRMSNPAYLDLGPHHQPTDEILEKINKDEDIGKYQDYESVQEQHDEHRPQICRRPNPIIPDRPHHPTGTDEVSSFEDEGNINKDVAEFVEDITYPGMEEPELSQMKLTMTMLKDIFDGSVLDGIPADIMLKRINCKYLKQFGEELDCKDALQTDYRGLAEKLNFAFGDVRKFRIKVLSKKHNKTVYILQEWIKREKSNATLFDLVYALYEMRRLDVIKIVFKALKGAEEHLQKTKKASYFLTQMKKKLFENDNDRYDNISVVSVQSTVSSIYSEYSTSSRSLQKSVSQWSLERYEHREAPSPDHLIQNAQPNGWSTDPKRKEPNTKYKLQVFVVHTSVTDKKIVVLLNYFRGKGVNVKSTLIDRDFKENKGQYVQESMENSDYVLVVCNKTYDECVRNRKDTPQVLDDDRQFIGTVNKMMLDDIYFNAGNCTKYIPVILAEGERKYVPKALCSSQIYRFPEKRKDLLMRLLKVEKFKLRDLGRCPDIQPQLVTGELQDFHI